MDSVRSVTPSAGVVTFTNSLNYLDTQSSFYHTFGLDAIIIQTIKHSKRQCATEKTDYLALKVLAFCNLYRLYIFCN